MQISEAIFSLKTPAIEPAGFEKDAKFWCYVCAVDVEKHNHTELYTIKFDGLIQHIGRYLELDH